MTRVTLNAINHALRAAGAAERLYRGTGYFYFGDGNAPMWPCEQGVYVARLAEMSVAEWVDAWREKHAQYVATRSESNSDDHSDGGVVLRLSAGPLKTIER